MRVCVSDTISSVTFLRGENCLKIFHSFLYFQTTYLALVCRHFKYMIKTVKFKSNYSGMHYICSCKDLQRHKRKGERNTRGHIRLGIDKGPDLNSNEHHFHSCLRRAAICNHNVGFSFLLLLLLLFFDFPIFYIFA